MGVSVLIVVSFRVVISVPNCTAGTIECSLPMSKSPGNHLGSQHELVIERDVNTAQGRKRVAALVPQPTKRLDFR